MKASLFALILIHSFYEQDCCREQHCHPVPCEEIESMASGWVWHPLGHAAVTFNRGTQKPSPDGACHVCVLDMMNTGMHDGICIYLPPRV